MNKWCCGALIAAAFVVAMAFRLDAPATRPMHHDEANQAVKFGALLETGDYRYDRADHHGPTLYYLTLPVAWAFGQGTLASLDERTVRMVPALFGAGLILLLPLLTTGFGRRATMISAWFVALSPVLTYFSRFYIQESLLAWCALAFVIACGRYVQRPSIGAALAVGAAAGFAYATKETSVIVLPLTVVAAAVSYRFTRVPGQSFNPQTTHLAAACGVALAIAFVFYSSFFSHPWGLFESIQSFVTYVDRGTADGAHAHGWSYYLGLLAFSRSGGVVFSEGLVLALAAAGLATVVVRPTTGFWPRYIALYAVLTSVAFSALRYKTPWNLLPFYVGFVLLAGFGADALISIARPRVAKWVVAAVLVMAAAQLGVLNWRANFMYPADPRNPYVYAQTSPDYLRLVQRITDLAAIHPDRDRMLVKVIAGPYEQWPLPWYLRRMGRVGYWSRVADAGSLVGVPVVVASQEFADAVGAAVGDRGVSEFYGLRSDVLLSVSIDRALWTRFLESPR